jgi:hypothetical protein
LRLLGGDSVLRSIAHEKTTIDDCLREHDDLAAGGESLDARYATIGRDV